MFGLGDKIVLWPAPTFLNCNNVTNVDIYILIYRKTLRMY